MKPPDGHFFWVYKVRNLCQATNYPWVYISTEHNHALLSVQFHKILIYNTCNFTESGELSEEDSFLIGVLSTGVAGLRPFFSGKCLSFGKFTTGHLSFPWSSSGTGGGGEISFLRTDLPFIMLELFADRSITGSDDKSFLLDVLLIGEGWILEIWVRELNSPWERVFDGPCFALLLGQSSMGLLEFSAFLLDDV